MDKRYTVGIVEDEMIEQTALSLMITRNRQNLEVIFTATDGKTALNLVRQYVPDILIVDIKIPEISGLELCSMLRKEGYTGYFIISTSYSLFNYAYQAIKLNVVDYLLKPTEEKQILDVLDRCISLLDEDKSFEEKEKKWKGYINQAKHDVDLWVMDQMMNGDKKMLPRLTEIGFPENGQWQSFWIAVSFDDSDKTSQEHRKELCSCLCSVFLEEFFVFASHLENKILAFIQPKKYYDIFQLYAMIRCEIERIRQYNHQEKTIFCYVSGICHSIEEMKEAGKGIPDDLSNLKLRCRDFISNIFFDQSPRAFTRDQYLFTMHRMLRLLQDKKIRQLENVVLAEIKQYTKKDCHKAWEYIRIFMDALISFGAYGNFSVIQKEIADPNLITDHLRLSKMIHESLLMCEAQFSEDTENSMDRILHIMQTEYASNLSQAEVAQRMGMTQPYFSRMFKNKIGKNFVSVLTDIRIEHAKQLILENNEITTEELASLCGYTSKTYFCALFRKTTGMTVSEYQRRRKYET